MEGSSYRISIAGKWANAMHIKCPHCLNAIDVVPDRPIESLTCPSCGSNFNLVDVNTATYGRAGDNKVGRFDLLELLGSGHFGDVWLAKDAELDRFVAVKLPRKEELQPADIELFLREARSAAHLKHPNIVSVHEVGKERDRIYIVSDVVRGPNLADWLLENKVSPQRAAELCATLCETVHYAHDQGIIHRDLKPSNVLLDQDNVPHLTDFGLAKRDGGEITITMDGKILGTPAYMSPEQARGDGHAADRRSDVYSLGVILYELLAGQRPFAGKSKMMMIHQVLHEDPRPLRSIKKSVPRNLETICLKAMSKEPDKRYQTARQMAEDLKRFLEGKPILARPASPLEKAWRWSRRNRSLAGSIAVVALLMCVVSALAWHSHRQSIALEPLRHIVKINTNPVGAKVAFIPLDSSTGEPRPENAVHAKQQTPISEKLAPGVYLVVAYLDEQRFTEVYRFVPTNPKEIPEANAHWFWRGLPTGEIELRSIEIPESSVSDGMALVVGSDDFEVGLDIRPVLRKHQRNVPPFLLDVHEVTVGDWKNLDAALGEWKMQHRYIHPEVKKRNIPDDFPMTFVTWDRAVLYAESIGKRLPDEFEYELAATAGGRRKFPWGDRIDPIGDWTFGPAGEPAFDRLDSDPPILALFSNVAEWTSSWATAYPDPQFPRFKMPETTLHDRMVRGGPASVVEGSPDVKEFQIGPRDRASLLRRSQMPGLGFRCARSTRPRLRSADFGHVIDKR